MCSFKMILITDKKNYKSVFPSTDKAEIKQLNYIRTSRVYKKILKKIN